MNEHQPNVDNLVMEVRAHLDASLAARDRAAAVQITQYAVRERGLPIPDLYVRVLTPLLVDTGSAWQQGTERVWEEHYATATVRTIVEGLYPDVMREAGRLPRLGRRVLLACPPGELHDLGLRMTADRMELAGWDAYFLGADTPTDEIAAAAIDLEVELIALSAATHYNRIMLRDVIEELKQRVPDVRIGIGGPAFVDDPEWPSDEILTDCNLGLVQDDPSCEV